MFRHASQHLLVAAFLCTLVTACGDDAEPVKSSTATSPLRVGVAAVPITPCGENPNWDGPVTSTGVWGEVYEDRNGNGRWDLGEPYTNDPRNSQLDPSSRTKYDGIFLAGFGSNRIALGCHDDIWARAIVLEAGNTKVALVSVDLVGSLKHGRYYGFAKAEAMVDPALGIDAFFYSSTHNHEAPDPLGLWGSEMFRDGKFPLYLTFVDQQVARAINEAGNPSRMRPVRLRAAVTNASLDPALRGLQVRTRCRPPWFFDDELRILQFLDETDRTVATLVNWNTHPESLEDENLYVSSDFPGFIRSRVEQALGGTALYFSGDLGAVEIVGDTCVGNADPRAGGTNEFDRRDDLGFARTQRLGELIGEAALRALNRAEELPVHTLDVKTSRYYLSGSNATFFFAYQIGLLDLDEEIFSPTHCPPTAQFCVPMEQQVLQILDRDGRAQVQFVTLPGEVFPELIYGVEQHARRDCPAAHTGEPYEPGLLAFLRARYRIFLGLSPDEFGYIVPGYDFYPAPSIDEEARDACHGQSYDPAFPNRRVPSHYHERLSVGVDIAAAVNCTVLQLLGFETEMRTNAACRRTFGLPPS